MDLRQDMGVHVIYLFAGLMGHGKTMLANEYGTKLAAGRPLLSNIEYTPRHPRYRDSVLIGNKLPIFDEYSGEGVWTYAPHDSVIIVDEADYWFDCSDHSKIARELNMALKQSRKRNQDWIFIVQSVSNLWVRIRRLAQRTILCVWDWKLPKNYMRLAGIRWSRFWRFEYASPAMKPRELVQDDFIWYTDAQPWFGTYKTDQIHGKGALVKPAATPIATPAFTPALPTPTFNLNQDFTE